MRPLIILRPEPGASATAAAARAMGLNPLVVPIFKVRSLDWEPPDLRNFDALLFTSANAVRYGGERIEALRHLPAHCVGDATAAAAREAGFDVAGVGPGRVDSLLQSLPTDLRLLHLCGFHRREPKFPNQAILAVPVYRSDELAPTENFAEIENGVAAIHSPRAGARFNSLADQSGLNRKAIAIAAISPEAAEAAGLGWQTVEAADEPTDPALLAIASCLCNNRG